MEATQYRDEDERQLAEMGLRQDLNRGWSAFSNFAISFTIISVLAGCFTTYGQAWNNGGPIAISWGWPLISIPILIIGFCTSEIVAKYPTAGGIYWWAARLGGPVWGWFTGWFNLVGLVGVVASVVYASATFLNVVLGLYGVEIFGINFGDDVHILGETFLLFAIILAVHATINIMRTHLLAVTNNISVFVHVVGVAVIIGILILVPDDHQSVDFVFTERINNSGFSMDMFWFYVLPLGFLLTQYTITGFDASAHISEETHNASKSAARGVWQSIFYSAVIGWFVLLAITFAANDPDAVTAGEGYGAGSSLEIFNLSLEHGRVQGGSPDLNPGPALLRPGLPHERVEDVLCLRPRPRPTRFEQLGEGKRERDPAQRCNHDGNCRPDHHPAGVEGQLGRRPVPVRVLRGRLDHRDRALHRLRDPDLPALAPRLDDSSNRPCGTWAASGGG